MERLSHSLPTTAGRAMRQRSDLPCSTSQSILIRRACAEQSGRSGSRSFMPRCGATFDEEGESPPWIRRGAAARCAAVGVARSVADEAPPTNHPRRGCWPRHPSSTREGRLFSKGGLLLNFAD
jgi:hypothetical protein